MRPEGPFCWHPAPPGVGYLSRAAGGLPGTLGAPGAPGVLGAPGTAGAPDPGAVAVGGGGE